MMRSALLFATITRQVASWSARGVSFQRVTQQQRPLHPPAPCTLLWNTPPRRNYSSSDDRWTIPDYVRIPEDQIDISFVRSSGAGGQNVNKVNSQVQIRVHVASAFWLPHEVRERLQQQESSRISKEGVLQVNSQEHRTQTANRKEALGKLQQMILAAWARPKKRKMRQGISKKTKEQRKEFKRRRSQVKENRRRVDDF